MNKIILSKHIFYFSLAVITFNSKAQAVDVKFHVDSLMQLFETMNEQERSKAVIQTFAQKIVLNDVEAALDYTNQIDEYAVSNKDTFLLATTQVLFSEYHWRKGEYPEGIERALQSAALAETDQRFQSVQAQALMTVGSIQFFSGNSLKAIDYYKQAAEVFKNQEGPQSYISVISNIGAVYADYGDKNQDNSAMDSALVYLNKVIELKGIAAPNFYLAALGNSAYIYVVQKNYLKAKELYDLWEAEESKAPNVTSRASQYVTIGMMYAGLGNYSRSEKYLTEGLKYAEEIGAKQRIGEYYEQLSELMELKNDHQQALIYAKNSWQLKDSLFNIENVSRINELETKYQAAKKEQEIQAANVIIEQNKRFQLFLSIVIVLIAVFSIASYFLLRQRFRLRRELLSHEIDNLRLQINALVGKGTEDIDIKMDDVNTNLNDPLTEREFDILRLALSDRTNKEIAEDVFVSVNTVKFHLKNIYEKIGVSNRKEALQYIIKPS